MTRVRPAPLAFVGLLALELLAWPAGLLCGLEISDELRLRREGAEVDARVVARRASERGRVEVRYRFDAPGADPRGFTRCDRTGRCALWSTLPASALEDAGEGRVRVRYLPADPRVNRPAAPAPGVSPLGDPIAAFIFLAAPLNGAAALLWRSLFRGLREASAAARQGKRGRWLFWRLSGTGPAEG